MNVNFNGNYANPKTTPSFGAINISETARRVLKKALSPEQINDLQNIIKKCNENKFVDIYISSETNEKSLHAAIGPALDIGDHIRRSLSSIPKSLHKSYDQVRYLESPIHFLSRVSKAAEKLKNKIDKRVNVIDKINKLK